MFYSLSLLLRKGPLNTIWIAAYCFKMLKRGLIDSTNISSTAVDDEYVIIGSANINQRTLAGDRDSEIAHGSYQPAHLNAENGRARGLVHGFRMSLWYEHFLSHYPGWHHVFLEPESLECVSTVRNISENLWEKYVGDEVVNLPGHLLPFPVRVSADGELSELTADGCFPYTKASIRGDGSVKSLAIPPILTT